MSSTNPAKNFILKILHVLRQLIKYSAFVNFRDKVQYTYWSVILLIQRIVFLCTGLIFALFKKSGNNPLLIELMIQLVNVSQVNSYSFNYYSEISPPATWLFFRSLIINLVFSKKANLKENFSIRQRYCLMDNNGIYVSG